MGPIKMDYISPNTRSYLIQRRIGHNGHYKKDILRETIQWATFGNPWKNKLAQETVLPF